MWLHLSFVSDMERIGGTNMRSLAMNRSRSAWTALILTGGAVAALFAAGYGEAQDAQDQGRAPAVSFAAPPTFADIIERVSPAVVNISVTKEVAAYPASSAFPFEDLLPFFGGDPGDQNRLRVVPQPRPVQGEGSGFIIDADGYIATNNHVVDGASEVTVTLSSGEQFQAEVVGTDPDTDLALIKVEEDANLPALGFGDSDRARVGDWVVAIGNPFGLGGTATAGIISARGRDIQSGPYDDYLQIDAPINSGNSGGPVFNAAGEVIGINTAIFSPNGGNIGIGFAIPANNAERILAELREGGTVSRGWLGVQIQDLNEELASHFALDNPQGALIAEVQPDSPAEAGGLEAGDIVTGLNGRDIDSARTLARVVGSLDQGEKVEIEVWRDGAREELEITIGDRSTGQQVASRGGIPGRAGTSLGLTVEGLTPELRADLNLPRDATGAVVTAVEPNSPAARQGIQVGDVIRSVNGQPVESARDVASGLAGLQSGDESALVLLQRNGSSRFVTLKPA
jgi:serine protease Do